LEKGDFFGSPLLYFDDNLKVEGSFLPAWLRQKTPADMNGKTKFSAWTSRFRAEIF
jgi:hypothetical protein